MKMKKEILFFFPLMSALIYLLLLTYILKKLDRNFFFNFNHSVDDTSKYSIFSHASHICFKIFIKVGRHIHLYSSRHMNHMIDTSMISFLNVINIFDRLIDWLCHVTIINIQESIQIQLPQL